MTKTTLLFAFSMLFSFYVFSQNIGINVTGASAASTNLLEVLQPTTATGAGTTAIYAEHPGAVAGATGYALQAIKTGASLYNVAAYLSASGGTNNYGLIVAAGNVGIGTINPVGKLDVNASGTSTIVTFGGTAAGEESNLTLNRSVNTLNAGINFNTAGSGNWQLGTKWNLGNKFALYNYNTSSYSLVVDISGNVGIGTTSPGALLDLGTAGTTAGTLRFAGSTSGNITMQTQAAAGTYNFNFPTSAGTSGQALLSGGGGAAAMTFGTLSVGAGGTGATSLTGMLKGDGTSAISAVTGTQYGVSYWADANTIGSTATGTSGQVLTSNGSAAPTWQTPSSGGAAPVGAIVAWHKSFANTPALPTGWVECNGQTLSDAGSVYNGQVIPNLNSDTQDGTINSGMFLRGASTSGTKQADATAVNGLSATTDAVGYAIAPPYVFAPSDPGSGDVPTVTLSSTDPETRPANMTVVWIMRVK